MIRMQLMVSVRFGTWIECSFFFIIFFLSIRGSVSYILAHITWISPIYSYLNVPLVQCSKRLGNSVGNKIAIVVGKYEGYKYKFIPKLPTHTHTIIVDNNQSYHEWQIRFWNVVCVNSCAECYHPVKGTWALPGSSATLPHSIGVNIRTWNIDSFEIMFLFSI